MLTLRSMSMFVSMVALLSMFISMFMSVFMSMFVFACASMCLVTLMFILSHFLFYPFCIHNSMSTSMSSTSVSMFTFV